MKKRSLQGRITAFILTLCVAATLMPISAFSEINVSYEHIDYKACSFLFFVKNKLRICARQLQKKELLMKICSLFSYL